MCVKSSQLKKARLYKDYQRAREDCPVDTFAELVDRFERAICTFDTLLATAQSSDKTEGKSGWLLGTKEPSLVDALLYSYTVSIRDAVAGRKSSTSAEIDGVDDDQEKTAHGQYRIGGRHTKQLHDILGRYDHVCRLTESLRALDPICTTAL